jgi:hypothetical protein
MPQLLPCSRRLLQFLSLLHLHILEKRRDGMYKCQYQKLIGVIFL